MRVLFVDDQPAGMRVLKQAVQDGRMKVTADFFDSADEAAASMGTTSFDLIVAAVRRIGDAGTQMLSAADCDHPDMARLALPAHPSLREQVPAHAYLPMPVQAQRLRHAMYGATRWRDQMGSAPISELVGGNGRVLSLPDIYVKIQDELNGPDPSVQRVAKLVEGDPAMSLAILKTVNSSFYGLRKQVGEVSEAAAMLGVESIASLVLAAGLFKASTPIERRLVERLWAESLRVGAIARKIVITEGLARADIEKAQLSGLLHDVGEMVIFQNWPKSYAAVDLDSRDDNERTLFGATHADISGFLCQTWDLDPVVVDSVSNHHQPSSSELPSKMSPLTAVHVARAALDAGFDPAGANLDLEHLEKIGMAGRVQAWFRLAAEVA